MIVPMITIATQSDKSDIYDFNNQDILFDLTFNDIYSTKKFSTIISCHYQFIRGFYRLFETNLNLYVH